MPLIPALRRQRQTDLCEFEASLVPGQALKATEKSCLKKNNNNSFTRFLAFKLSSIRGKYSAFRDWNFISGKTEHEIG